MNLTEPNEKKTQNIKSNILKSIVDYIYTRSIDISMNNVEETLRESQLFQLINLTHV